MQRTELFMPNQMETITLSKAAFDERPGAKSVTITIEDK